MKPSHRVSLDGVGPVASADRTSCSINCTRLPLLRHWVDFYILTHKKKSLMLLQDIYPQVSLVERMTSRGRCSEQLQHQHWKSARLEYKRKYLQEKIPAPNLEKYTKTKFWYLQGILVIVGREQFQQNPNSEQGAGLEYTFLLLVITTTSGYK
ncbi:hypothetical protein Naga_100364g2 [Nannochloropsis gaditana]|uniref:Uncharacterized protein n=1 Tax=Nannochloropsis gaditana TaxID=72520 RepID=W7TKJ8_9STRA|nr:hypothetical protein Naga_100364g2 [Nannochloropsis gaditana]